VKVFYHTSPSGEVKYELQPQSPEECRFLTILRNLCVRPDVVVRVLGGELLDPSVVRAGLPEDAVMSLGIMVDSLNGTPLKDVEKDPSKLPLTKENVKRYRKDTGEVELRF
jgi:hypothetical protein